MCIAKPSAVDDDFAIVGDIAHIYPHSPDGPRGHENVSGNFDRDSYGNWILLCASHHRLVDGQPRSHPGDWLWHIRSRHEGWIEERLSGDYPRILRELPFPHTIVNRIYRVFKSAYHPLTASVRIPPLGRFDDPYGEFPMLYAATSARAAWQEIFSYFTSSPPFFDSTWPEVASPIHGRELAEIQTSNLRFFRLDNDGERFAQRAMRSRLGEFADVRFSETKDRRVSQALARWLNETDVYDGIIYPSRFGGLDEDVLVALFPRALPKMRVIRVTTPDPRDFA